MQRTYNDSPIRNREWKNISFFFFSNHSRSILVKQIKIPPVFSLQALYNSRVATSHARAQNGFSLSSCALARARYVFSSGYLIMSMYKKENIYCSLARIIVHYTGFSLLFCFSFFTYNIPVYVHHKARVRILQIDFKSARGSIYQSALVNPQKQRLVIINIPRAHLYILIKKKKLAPRVINPVRTL